MAWPKTPNRVRATKPPFAKDTSATVRQEAGVSVGPVAVSRDALRRTRFLQPRRPNPRCESHTRAVPLPGGLPGGREHRTQTPRWRAEGGGGERIGTRELIAALFVTLEGFGEGAPAS